MDARARLACYPRGNFYPLNNGLSTKCQRVTISYFRNCSTCGSHSKACLCYYTLHSVSIGVEQTFEILRYILAGNRPSQTARLALSPEPGNGLGYRDKKVSRWCYTFAFTLTKIRVSSLPSTLCRQILITMPSCSKAPRGLLVRVDLDRIFTVNSMFAEHIVGTAPPSLNLSCGTPIKRRGISLP